jgi:alpha-mannosidase
VKLLNEHIENKDSIITYQSKRIEIDSIAYSNIDNALKELKTANEINKDLFENSQKELRKKKRENIFVKIGLFALGIFAIVK